jgi:hypothetical protein
MGEKTALRRALLVAGAAATLTGLVPLANAGAATVPKPSASCKVPVFSVSPLSAKPGTKVTVSGVNFSGCTAQGSTAKPTAVLTVQVGVQTASQMGAVLATTKTSATGSFSVQVTVPALTTAGVAKLELAAAAKDPATGLAYAGIAVLAYDTSGGGTPTDVPAGTGGQAASTSRTTREGEIGLLGAGVLVAGLGGVGLARREKRK